MSKCCHSLGSGNLREIKLGPRFRGGDRSLPVLNYHVVQVREGEYGGSVGEREYFISKKNFREQLEFLRKEKFSALKLMDLSDWSHANPMHSKKTMLTFD